VREAALISVAAAAVCCSANAVSSGTGRAIFAGGCFWCMEEPFEKLPGVVSVTSGFAGGSKPNPTYREVSAGNSGYAESVQIVFDPSRITYERLLEVFWRNIDPLTPDGQFCDRGRQYRSAIFYQDDEQKRLAEESKRRVEQRLQAAVVTEIVPASKFYPAEASHQDFYKTNPGRYREYVEGCGRYRRLEQLWGSAAGGTGGTR
jgi:peptide-methionine (S)-S-oxide reductase